MTEQRSDEAIRADLVKRGERAGPFPADGVQAALRRLGNDVEPLLAEVRSLRGVVQAVELALLERGQTATIRCRNALRALAGGQR